MVCDFATYIDDHVFLHILSYLNSGDDLFNLLRAFFRVDASCFRRLLSFFKSKSFWENKNFEWDPWFCSRYKKYIRCLSLGADTFPRTRAFNKDILGCTFLEKIRIVNNQHITSVKSLGCLPRLKHLVIIGCPEIDTVSIKKLIEKTKSLRRFTLDDVCLSIADLMIIFESVMVSPSIEYVKVRYRCLAHTKVIKCIVYSKGELFYEL